MESFQIKRKILPDLVVVLATLLLISVVGWAFFLKEDPIPLAGPAIIIFFIIGGIGTLVLFFAFKMIIRRPATITINQEGFEYNPGGVSTGFIPWTNVAEIKEVEVRTQKTNSSGPVWETTLGIKLKEPAPYRNQYPSIIRGLMKVNDNMYDADIFFRLTDFGNQVDEVKTLMYKFGKRTSL
jgi:hypothetical protein